MAKNQSRETASTLLATLAFCDAKLNEREICTFVSISTKRLAIFHAAAGLPGCLPACLLGWQLNWLKNTGVAPTGNACHMQQQPAIYAFNLLCIIRMWLLSRLDCRPDAVSVSLPLYDMTGSCVGDAA